MGDPYGRRVPPKRPKRRPRPRGSAVQRPQRAGISRCSSVGVAICQPPAEPILRRWGRTHSAFGDPTAAWDAAEGLVAANVELSSTRRWGPWNPRVSGRLRYGTDQARGCPGKPGSPRAREPRRRRTRQAVGRPHRWSQWLQRVQRGGLQGAPRAARPTRRPRCCPICFPLIYPPTLLCAAAFAGSVPRGRAISAPPICMADFKNLPRPSKTKPRHARGFNTLPRAGDSSRECRMMRARGTGPPLRPRAGQVRKSATYPIGPCLLTYPIGQGGDPCAEPECAAQSPAWPSPTLGRGATMLMYTLRPLGHQYTIGCTVRFLDRPSTILGQG